MADKSFRVEVVSADERLYSGDATLLVAQTTDGEVGILAGHAPLLGQLTEGGYVAITEAGGERRVAAVTGGFLSVAAEVVTILAETAEWAHTVDVAAEEAALESAEPGSAAHQLAKSRLAAAAALAR
ncbi:ATP synthase epsilon chain [Gordonia araii NBRC 100433]|uniref:ATP synthase epsilon chain n=1 Tax=Gordonia araii NBRC 100433 TaxID=1073574 RepID=G7H6R2_9ACTN|nr:F0F1 ATP synthase subunit epsilon [Gordonia araii]NNG98625.1 F0F1 ATP synthase subunit epsilon [Gordonia araii NBRC 100433]GAB11537.1 ATP synthase epsilon chain [Gordonia araii NBRC 100433]